MDRFQSARLSNFFNFKFPKKIIVKCQSKKIKDDNPVIIKPETAYLLTGLLNGRFHWSSSLTFSPTFLD
jgi:hypothetical protein